MHRSKSTLGLRRKPQVEEIRQLLLGEDNDDLPAGRLRDGIAPGLFDERDFAGPGRRGGGRLRAPQVKRTGRQTQDRQA